MASKRCSNGPNIASSCEPSLKQLDNTLPDLQLEGLIAGCLLTIKTRRLISTVEVGYISCPSLDVDTRVEARFGGRNEYRMGQIMAVFFDLMLSSSSSVFDVEYDYGGTETNVRWSFIRKLDNKDDGVARKKHVGRVSKRNESEAKDAENSRITDMKTTASWFLKTAESEATTSATTSTPHERDADIKNKTQDDYDDDTQLDNPLRWLKQKLRPAEEELASPRVRRCRTSSSTAV